MRQALQSSRSCSPPSRAAARFASHPNENRRSSERTPRVRKTSLLANYRLHHPIREYRNYNPSTASFWLRFWSAILIGFGFGSFGARRLRGILPLLRPVDIVAPAPPDCRCEAWAISVVRRALNPPKIVAPIAIGARDVAALRRIAVPARFRCGPHFVARLQIAGHPVWKVRKRLPRRQSPHPVVVPIAAFIIPSAGPMPRQMSSTAEPCLNCGRQPLDAHHLRFAQNRAAGRKVSDEFTVPLCRGHHREVHRSGDETAWWRQIGIDPTKIALKLWRQTRLTVAPATSAIARQCARQRRARAHCSTR